MKHAVVAGVAAHVALVEVDVVNAVQAVGVPELDVDRLVQVLFELGAERVELTAGVLALVEVQRQEVLQIVTVGAARRREHSTEPPVEQGSLDVVERVVGVPGHGAESRRQRGERRQQRMPGERVHHPGGDAGTGGGPGIGLHVHRDPPGLATLLEHADLQVRRGCVVLALVAVGATAEHTVQDRHHQLLRCAGLAPRDLSPLTPAACDRSQLSRQFDSQPLQYLAEVSRPLSSKPPGAD